MPLPESIYGAVIKDLCSRWKSQVLILTGATG